MRHLGLLALRLVVGGYATVHGAQKLFGAFGGHGVDGTGQVVETTGVAPGRQLATLSGVAEFGGGLLTATGIAHPLGPVAVAANMATAASTHLPKGPMAADGGYELPLTNAAAALAIAAGGAGPFRLGPRLSRPLAFVVTLGAAAVAAYAISQVLAQQGEAAASEPDAATAIADEATASV